MKLTLGTWYTFIDGTHHYGYTLFYPLSVNSPKYDVPYYYGMVVYCDDSGSWVSSGFGRLENELEDSAEPFYPKRSGKMPKPKDLIRQTFDDSHGRWPFIEIMKKDDGWIR